MQMLKRSLPWLALAVLALSADYAGVDLRLLAGVACGMAVISASASFGRVKG
jgi:hypothetical protein